MINGEKFAVVLGGGASFGFAHLGVLRFLSELNVVPDIITGTSIGSLIGGVYALGMQEDEIMERVENFDRNQVLDKKIIPFFGESFLYSKKIDDFLQELFGPQLIENCKIAFASTAVDINNGKLKYFTKGSLWQAVRASISFPGAFLPFEIDGIKYIDGGVMDNLPISIAKEMGAKKVLAVNVVDYSVKLGQNKNILQSLINALSLAQKELIRLKTKADLTLNIKLKDVDMLKFKKQDILNFIKQGYIQAKRKRTQILKMLNLVKD